MKSFVRLFVGIGLVLSSAGIATAAVDISAGLRFSDGSTFKQIVLTATATFELFVSTPDAAQMDSYFIGLSASTATDGGTQEGLDFASEPLTHLANWDYSQSVMDGPLVDRLSTGNSSSPSDDIAGPFTELVVDSIVITPLEKGTWTIAPELPWDVIISDRVDPAPGNSLDPTFSSLTLVVVPEPATVLLFAFGGPAFLRRRR